MIKRFLAYSLDHHRPVKALFLDTMKYKNITVTALTEDTVTFLASGRKKPETMPLSGLLSVSYARGDDGDTLQYVQAPDEAKKEEQT